MKNPALIWYDLMITQKPFIPELGRRIEPEDIDCNNIIEWIEYLDEEVKVE